MPEVPLDFPRQWVEFVDPADDNQLIRADLTWLTSRWTCIFGRGCQGIDAARPDAGCCVHGAHFAEKKDHKRVARWVEKLTPELWENHDIGHKGGWTEKEDGASKTRVVDNACIFHNSEGSLVATAVRSTTSPIKKGSPSSKPSPRCAGNFPCAGDTKIWSTRTDPSASWSSSVNTTDATGGRAAMTFPWYCTGNPEGTWQQTRSMSVRGTRSSR